MLIDLRYVLGQLERAKRASSNDTVDDCLSRATDALEQAIEEAQAAADAQADALDHLEEADLDELFAVECECGGRDGNSCGVCSAAVCQLWTTDEILAREG